MIAPPLMDRPPVSLSTVDTIRARAPKTQRAQRDVAAGDVLVGQARSRIAAALGATLVQLAFIFWLAGRGSPAMLLGVTFVYAAFAGATAIAIGHRRRASPAVVTLVMAGDLAFIFAMTVVGTTPAHYERALFGAMIVIHLANFYFGRRQAWRTIVLSVLGYAILIVFASRHALVIDRVEELWSLAIGAGGTVLVIVQSGHVRRRLQVIVGLFESAEEGDFSQSYDETADVRPDAITRVGRAYNRVRSQLASMVLTDPLTGCLNRRGFDQALAREVARSARAGSELALLALDLDHFKAINDTYGHLTGDEVLRAAGTLLNHTKRAGDVVARTGGEEFAVLLPDTDAAGAFQFANRLCEVLRRHAFPPATPGGPPMRITTSIGVVSGAPLLDGDAAALFSQRADIALYAAKRSGRDRVRAWGDHLRSDDKQLILTADTHG
ncbi:MAG TPA: GGDEF domain-containing protein [Gemmatimonadaceae bacterium]